VKKHKDLTKRIMDYIIWNIYQNKSV